jgi:hypothetical protein
VSILNEMHRRDGFDSARQFSELRRMLAEAMARGLVQEVPVTIIRKVPYVENWYRDNETGEIYALSPFNPPARGAWHRIDVDIKSK